MINNQLPYQFRDISCNNRNPTFSAETADFNCRQFMLLTFDANKLINKISKATASTFFPKTLKVKHRLFRAFLDGRNPDKLGIFNK